MWVYEVFLSFKCLVRIATHGFDCFTRGVLSLGNVVQMLSLVGGCVYTYRSLYTQHYYLLFFALSLVAVVCASTILTASVLALGFV